MADLTCPIHGPVEGLFLTEGPLSEPTECYPLVCEKCEPHVVVVVGYEHPETEEVAARWEDLL